MYTVASIPIPGKRSLLPVKNGESFIKSVDRNFSPIFTEQWIYTLNEANPYFHWAFNTINIKLEGGAWA